ncbi:MAG TPA: restriction endonuclease [Gammaproteobacteria bacterium]|nr:restriction endonuclease [Gammaproteobacteria bacterium]
MESKEVVEKILHVRAWHNKGVRAPHKPLLLLYALAKFLDGQHEIPYVDLEVDLKNLLSDFGPPRKSHRPEYPFWRLQHDKIWQVSLTSQVKENNSGDVSRKALLDAEAYGFFTEKVVEIFTQEPSLVNYLIKELLESNFPNTIHEDILQSIGINLQEYDAGFEKRKRCSKFREKILQAYEYRCAVCGFDVRLGHTPIALEAAHIKWHQAGGPDIERNGLALCALHHKLFDRGAFTLSAKSEILVSDKANGHNGFRQWLMQYHGKRIHSPQSKCYTPEYDFLSWHTEEVFQGNFREMSSP